jgi:hypothetical protein
MCEVTKSEILMFNFSNIVPRNDECNGTLLEFALEAYCKKLRGEGRTASQERLLEWCRHNSLVPLRPALFKLYKPFRGFNVYEMGAYDFMHTLSGVLENYASSTGVCIVEVGKYPNYRTEYYDNIGRLDIKIANLPRKHGVPINMRHFSDGVSGILGLRSNENTSRTSGSGNLGLIDDQDVPQLVLQLILCKCEALTYHVENNEKYVFYISYMSKL